MPDRTTYSAKPLATAAIEEHQREDESFSDFILRAAAVLDAVENGTAVTEPSRSATDTSEDAAPLTEAHIDDISNEVARKTADEIEALLR